MAGAILKVSYRYSFCLENIFMAHIYSTFSLMLCFQWAIGSLLFKSCEEHWVTQLFITFFYATSIF